MDHRGLLTDSQTLEIQKHIASPSLRELTGRKGDPHVHLLKAKADAPKGKAPKERWNPKHPMPDASSVSDRSRTRKNRQRILMGTGIIPRTGLCTWVTWVDLLTLVLSASLEMLTGAQPLLAILPFGNSKAGLGCLPWGLVPIHKRYIWSRARTVWRQGRGDGDTQRGPLTAEPFWWLWLWLWLWEETERKGFYEAWAGDDYKVWGWGLGTTSSSHAQEAWISSQW